jgi:iron complex outermembrane receptor protein
VRASGYVTGALAPNLAADLAVLEDRSDGFLTKLSTDDHNIGDYNKLTVRTGLKFKLTDDDYLLARFVYTNHEDSSVVNYSIYQAPNGRYETAADAFAIPGASWGRERGQTDSDPGLQPTFRYRVYAAQLTGKFDLDFANLSSYTQYRDELSSHDLDIDGSSAPIVHAYFPNVDKTFTQEVLLNSKPGGPLDWVAGGFFMHQKTGQVLSFIMPPAGAAYDINNTVQSIAGFADATYRAVGNLYLTGGLRYSHESNEGGWDCFAGAPVLGTPCPGQHLEGSWNNVSPRAVLRYALTPDSSVYASWARGYKAGMIDPNGFSTNLVAPEKLNSYEGGFKYGGGRARLNASGFYYDYKDLQQFVSQGTYSITTNAAKSKMYGAELSGGVELIEGLSVDGGVAWTHARYDQYLAAPANTFNFATGQVSSAPTDVSGNRMIRAPEWSGNIAATYLTEAFKGELAFSGNAYFTTEVFFDPANLNRQGGYCLLGARIAWTDPGKHFTVALLGANLADTRYVVQVLPNGFGVGSVWGTPRTYGVSLSYKY